MKIAFVGTGCVSRETWERNEAHARSLGLSYVRESERPPLAVVGGGHSIKSHVDALRSWRGDVWAIGSAFQWCRGHGINATYFCVDPMPDTSLVEGVDRAILATGSDPSTFAALKDANVEIFDLFTTDKRCNHGPTSATAVPELAVGEMGYRDVSFFGCDSSYAQTTHAYKSHDDPYLLRVMANGESFLTGEEFLMQAEVLSAMIRAFPVTLKERSGGLLGALVVNPDYDVTHVSKWRYGVMQREAA